MALKDFFFFWRQQEDPELARRKRLLQSGRIAEGFITDADSDENGVIRHIFYRYSASGSDFDSSQELLGEQLTRSEKYVPGQNVSVRYDPHQPVNSFIA